MSKVLVGVDPSFNRTGIAVYNNGIIRITEVKGKEVLGVDKFSKSFEGIFKESKILSREIIVHIINACRLGENDSVEIISECPPPQGQYAPGLYALDVRMFTSYGKIASEVYRVYPNYLMHIHGKRNYDKSESAVLAKKILENYQVELLTKRLSHDESEAVIFLSRLLYKEGLLPDSIVELIPNIKNEKEAIFEY